MTEPEPEYRTTNGTYSDIELVPEFEKMPRQFTRYLELRRAAVIMELRELDRALGRPQTVPKRHRGG